MLNNFFDANYLYSLVESSRSNISPIRLSLMLMQNWYNNPANNALGRMIFSPTFRAGIEIAERITRTYKKPEFNINHCQIDDKSYLVMLRTVKKDFFCHLLHFAKPELKEKQPKLLIIAPMAGHHATLLRGTIQDLLPYFDIYVTDWVNANQVPITNGSFDLDDFIDYLINYMKLLGPNVHVLAVCQPTVPALAATALMSQEKDPNIPKSLTLIGGPIDARQNPTKPNDFAINRNLQWFDQVLITNVPANYPGYRRRVYPGFLQLTGFMAMNIQKHVQSHIDLYKSLVVEDDEKAEKQRSFYDEYLSVMDLTAEFYLQTIKEVFHNFSLAKGEFYTKGRHADLNSITKTSIMGIEGGRDDIAAVGQTKAALELCAKLPDSKKKYHLQPDVGHYGAFSGNKFRRYIVPQIKEFIYDSN